ncbi:MAG: hypothetical protein KKE05_00590, partial [Nanoarchaeota archaeon]|nr:hypothetical protein [Nanoarchaeota archaeon]
MEEDKRAKFIRVYANLPEELKEDILVVVNKKPYTWNSVFIEVKDDTDLGQENFKSPRGHNTIMEKKNISQNVKISEEMKETVIARIDAQVPSNLKLAIGGHGGMDKEEMIEHIKKGDEIGKQIVKRHILFLRS